MVEVPTKSAETLDIDAVNDAMVSHFENIKSEIGEIMVKMKIQPALAKIVNVGGGGGAGKRKVAMAVITA